MSALQLLVLTHLLTALPDNDDGPLRVAIVVGNNRGADDAQQDLRYADDDAIATAAVLTEAGVTTMILTRPDEATHREHPAFVADGAPTTEALERAVAALAVQVRAAEADGRRTELLFFFSGHGDVDRGEGFLILEGGRLSRSDLHGKVLERVGASSSHVIIDACRSSFMAYARGAGGVRAPARPGFATVASTTGYVLSTSTGRDSHEWERFQAGVFSHEVRSALRGAADVDGDGRISYAELGGFLEAANASIKNELLRPDFLVRAPGVSANDADLDDVLLAWPPGDTFVIDEAVGRVSIDDADLRRVVDIPPTTGGAARVVLHVPAARPLYISTDGGTLERVLDVVGSVSFSMLPPPQRPSTDKRGRDSIYAMLFSSPFGPAVVEQWRVDRPPTVADDPPPLRPLAVAAWTSVGVAGAAAAVGAAAAAAGWFVYADGDDPSQSQLARVEHNATINALNVTSVVAAGVAALGAVTAGAAFVLDGHDAQASDSVE